MCCCRKHTLAWQIDLAAILFAYDLIVLHGEDFRPLPLGKCKARLLRGIARQRGGRSPTELASSIHVTEVPSRNLNPPRPADLPFFLPASLLYAIIGRDQVPGSTFWSQRFARSGFGPYSWPASKLHRWPRLLATKPMSSTF
jgi:hypothetical protein